MRKSTRRGFTLVELLVTIILLGVIGAIVIYNMTSVTSNSKDADYERYIAAVKSASATYSDVNPDAFNELFVNKSFLYITVNDLVTNGYLDENLTNPYTGEVINYSDKIKASLDTTTGGLTFEYPVQNEEKETFLVSISDYVVWGEPYDCMQGAGTYLLALSDEEGNLLQLDQLDSNGNIVKDGKTIVKDFKCEYPKGFTNVAGFSGKATQEAGTYDITYTWLTESGTKKSATRSLRVLSKVKPSFKLAERNGSATGLESKYLIQDVANGNNAWYTPAYTASTKTWKTLTYAPSIDGADEASTSYKIEKQVYSTILNTVNNAPRVTVTGTDAGLQAGFTKNFDNIFDVDDGSKTYYITTKVSGHYKTDYSYEANGKAIIQQKLIIPIELVSTPKKNWTTDITLSISDLVHSPVGIKEFEYMYSNNESEANDKTLRISKDSCPQENCFVKTLGATSKKYSVLGNGCVNKSIEYKYIYIRAVNKDGYVGDWVKVDSYLTNAVSDLFAKGGYTSQNKIVVLQGKENVKYNVVANNSDGTLLLAYTGTYGNYSPTTVQYGSWGTQTCDGYYSTSYSYSSPLSSVLQNAANSDFLRNMLPSNYSKILKYSSYYINGSRYNGYVILPSSSQVSSYKQALMGSYWIPEVYTTGFSICVHGSWCTSKSNYYFYRATVTSSGVSSRLAYGGGYAPIKPMINTYKVYTGGGDGTAANPYRICV